MKSISSSSARVLIFDTTLRDGEQSPGGAMNTHQKTHLARELERLGVDIIEAGFPAASRGDFEAVKAIADSAGDVIICGLSRAVRDDIEKTARAIEKARRKRIHTFVATSPIHMASKSLGTEDMVLEAVRDSVTYARNLTDDVEWSAEDSTRSEIDFLCRCVEVAIKAGAKTINLPDTVGFTTPKEYANLFRIVLETVPGADSVVLSAHCHNDLGLAVANSLAAIEAGVRQVECTVNGIGERAGNASLEEIVMALRVRNSQLPFSTGIVTERICPTSRLVSTFTGLVVQPNKAIVGRNAFAHASGIHQSGMLRNAMTYEIMTPESVGNEYAGISISKLSGRAGVLAKLGELDLKLSTKEFEEVFKRIIALGDTKKVVYDSDILAIVNDVLAREADDRFEVLDFEFVKAKVEGTRKIYSIELSLLVEGAVRQLVVESRDGPVDAAFSAIATIIADTLGVTPTLEHYSVESVTSGKDAQGTATVRLSLDGKKADGVGSDTDILSASVAAYVNACNRLLRITEAPLIAERPGRLEY